VGAAQDQAVGPLSSKAKRLGEALLEIALIIVTFVIGWLVWSLIIWGQGQTPAKQLLHMRVVLADTGQRATFWTMALREGVGKWVLGVVSIYLLVSSIFVIVDKRSQALWDKFAATLVIDEPRS
jgi:uncharacterized RDD family membrane protein YckC